MVSKHPALRRALTGCAVGPDTRNMWVGIGVLHRDESVNRSDRESCLIVSVDRCDQHSASAVAPLSAL